MSLLSKECNYATLQATIWHRFTFTTKLRLIHPCHIPVHSKFYCTCTASPRFPFFSNPLSFVFLSPFSPLSVSHPLSFSLIYISFSHHTSAFISSSFLFSFILHHFSFSPFSVQFILSFTPFPFHRFLFFFLF